MTDIVTLTRKVATAEAARSARAQKAKAASELLGTAQEAQDAAELELRSFIEGLIKQAAVAHLAAKVGGESFTFTASRSRPGTA